MLAKNVLCGATALGFSVTPLLADVTADDYWSALTEVVQSTGATISSQVSVDGATTTFGNIALQYDLPMGVGSIGMYVGSMFITENRDGTLTVTYPSTIPLQINGRIDDGAFFARASVDLTGAALTVSGSPLQMDLASSIDSMRITLDDFRYKDQWDSFALSDLERGLFEGVITDSQEEMRITLSDMVEIESTATSGEVEFTYDFAFDGVGASGSEFIGSSESAYYIALIPGGFSLLELNRALKDGLAIEGTSSSFDNRSIQNVTSIYGDASATEATIDSQTAEMRFDRDGIVLNADGQGITAIVNEDLIGLSIGFVMDSFGFGMSMPIMASDALQPAALSSNITGFRLDESAVGMLQMMATMSVGESIPPSLLGYIDDPMTMEFDVGADVLLGFDLFDFAVYDTLDPDNPPIDLDSVSINRLYFDFADVQLDASGAFDVDLDDFETFDGEFPKVAGAASAKLTGLNAILNTLMDTGLIAPDEMMPVRMGLGMFTKVVGDDELLSEVEVTDDGRIFVNGQRLK